VSGLTLVLFVVGLVLLVAGADIMVRGAARLALAIGISPLVVGLTVVAFGTSAPELAVNLQGAFTGRADVALGNVIGSNICNVLLILGLSALAAPLTVAQGLVRVEVPLMIAASVLVYLMGLDGSLARLEGMVLFSGIIAYTVYAIRQSRREQRVVAEEYEAAFGKKEVKARGPWDLVLELGLVVVGIAMLTLGSHWLVGGAVEIAISLGVSELIVGLTIVAIGTSLPEVATSIVASLKGERDIAVGNVVGSNLFNLLCVLGATASVAPDGIAVSAPALAFDMPVMIAVAVACLPIFFTGWRIDRWEGALFLGFYGAYMGYLVLKSMEHDALPLFSFAMGAFVIPITVLTLGLVVIRSLREGRRRRPPDGSDLGG
jgi:cation:H+ antiporter